VTSGGVRACALGTVGGADGDAVSCLSAGVAFMSGAPSAKPHKPLNAKSAAGEGVA